MMLLCLTCVPLAIVAMLLYCQITDQKKYGHIPGPRKLPLLGNMLQLHKKDARRQIPLPHIITELARKHGEVMWIKLGFTNLVVLSGYNPIYEALVLKGADFANRPSFYRFKATQEDNGLAGMSYTPTCRVLRNIYHRALKMYGDSVDKLETVVLESIHDLTEDLGHQQGQPVPVKETLMAALANTIYIMVFGQQIGQSKVAYQSLLNLEKMVNEGFGPSAAGILIDEFPVMRYVFSATFKKALNYAKMRDDFWTEQIDIHKSNWDGIEERCLLDILLKEQKNRVQNASEVQLSDSHVTVALSVLFVAGFMTSSTFLTGVILILLHKPDVQDKLYAEICSVVGATGQVSMKHKHQLHYTRAVLFEGLRYISVVPFDLFHQTSKDTSVGGYPVPNDTTCHRCVIMK